MLEHHEFGLQGPQQFLEFLSVIPRDFIGGSESVVAVPCGIPADKTHGLLVLQAEEFQFLRVQMTQFGS